MIKKLKLFEGRGFDPYYNLAVEQQLLETVAEDCCILYLWQNQNTVVIGRNQNPWKECRTTLLEQEGGYLARRLSGGGAVFHDLGNLNFTFLLPQSEYDLHRQLSVICEAVRSLGLEAEISGRNDILVQGRKFSGNAFYKNGKQACHHGTLLVEADMSRLGRYLNPSKAKLEAKGVDSVRSRVVNLRELAPEISVSGLKTALESAFSRVYGLPVERIGPEQLDGQAVEQLRCRNESWQWKYGIKMPFTFSCEGRFPWGGLQIRLQVERGQVLLAQVHTDAMEWELASGLENALVGIRFDQRDMMEAVKAAHIPYSQDICRLIEEQEL